MIIVCHVIFQDHMIKGNMALRAGDHQGGSINILSSLVVKSTVLVDIMILLSRHLTRTRDKRIIWLYGQERIKVGYVPAKFGDHRPSDSGDIMILTCHIISQDHVIKGLYAFTDWSPSR